jgi:hypothetical protein
VGCSDCGAKGGCDTRKGAQHEVLEGVLARIYPDRLWGRPDDEARFRAGISRGEAQRMARSISSLLRAPTRFRPGAEEDLCDFVWILCVGREPSLLEVREGRAAAESPRIEETWLRVALSTVARLAAVQEVRLVLSAEPEMDAGSGTGMSIVRELPRAGVYDPVLLQRLRKLTGFLEASDVRYLDFGLLDVPVEGGSDGGYTDRYGVAPRLVNYLFYAAPPTTQVIASLPIPHGVRDLPTGDGERLRPAPTALPAPR